MSVSSLSAAGTSVAQRSEKRKKHKPKTGAHRRPKTM